MSLFDLFRQDTDTREIMAGMVALGEDCKAFIPSRVGEYLVSRAEEYEMIVLRQLRDVDVENVVKLCELQAEAKIPGKLLQWLEEAISEGKEAQFQLEETDNRED